MTAAEPSRTDLIALLGEARRRLASPGNDFTWTTWQSAEAALAEIDRLITTLGTGPLPDRLDLEVLFAPTGPIQEVSHASGWATEFLDLANRFDAAIGRLYA